MDGYVPLRLVAKLAEYTAYGVGAALLAVALLTGWAGDRALAAAGAPSATGAVNTAPAAGDPPAGGAAWTRAGTAPALATLDAPLLELAQADWAPDRIRAYAAAAADAQQRPPAGVLRVPRLGIEAAVFDGTDEWALNLGVGRVPGTARVGAPGNLAVAGHRDGFFRRLEHVAHGDAIDVVADGHVHRYVVERTLVVEPTDVRVLEPTAQDTLTLVTCYPFRFVGRAPQRFIVRATRTDAAPAATARSIPSMEGARR